MITYYPAGERERLFGFQYAALFLLRMRDTLIHSMQNPAKDFQFSYRFVPGRALSSNL
jgi:hypothetical protein